MTRREVFALSPAVWGAAFVLFVFATRDTLAKDVGMVGFVVGIELFLTFVGFVLALVQLPLMVIAVFNGRRRLAGACAVGICLWVGLWVLGMGLSPSMVYVT